MEQQEHNLLVESVPNGFRIYPSSKGKERGFNPVTCKIDDRGFWQIQERMHSAIPLYSFYDLLNCSVSIIYQYWIGNGKKPGVIYKIKKWATEKTAKSLNHLVHNEWRRAVDSFDPFYGGIHKKLFSISGGKGNIYALNHIKDMTHLRDILKYKAAAVDLIWGIASPDWQSSYSYRGIKYRSINKTLMNLPGNVNWASLPSLKYFRLPEPATTRLKLMAYCSLYGHHYYWEERIAERQGVILRSSEEDIKNAIKLWWHYFPDEKTGDFRRTLKIMQAFRMIFDYPGSYDNIDIMGLARRSEVYHHDMVVRRRLQEEQMAREFQQREEKLKILKVSKTKLPPIPFPDDPKIRFLSSYKDVENEGNHMGHCVGSYAESAVLGKCYLFHVDHNGEEATVEVGNGFVKQSYGPHNCRNSASKYGQAVLTQWAKLMK